MEVIIIVALVVGVGLGFGAGWLIQRKQTELAVTQARAELQPVLASLEASQSTLKDALAKEERERKAVEERLVALDKERDQLAESKASAEARLPRIDTLEKENQDLQQRLESANQATGQSREDTARLTQENANLSARLAEAESLQARTSHERDALRQARDQLSDSSVQTKSELEAEQRRASDLESRLKNANSELDQIRTSRDSLATAKAELETRLEADKSKFEEKLELLEQAKEALTNQFQVLANRILEEKSERFTQLNQQQLTALLGPLGEKLKDFETKVQTVYDNESQQRTALKTEIIKLVEANARISEDTTNLTRALKGEAKAQGNWGEMVLERALEMAGLARDREYRVQQSLKDDDGNRLRPDVILDLPEQRNMVIDSKVSLTSYERYIAATNDIERQSELTQHVASVRSHMTSLSKQDYQRLYSLNSIDFVIMFVPIESAYSIAIQADPALTQDALKKNVIIVYPSTLLMALRTIAHVWRYEYQNRNAQEIARQAGSLYDKFYGFVDDLKSIGDRLNKAQAAFQAAENKLVSGRGNLVKSADKLRLLGVKPKSPLPASLLDLAGDGEDEVIDEQEHVPATPPSPEG